MGGSASTPSTVYRRYSGSRVRQWPSLRSGPPGYRLNRSQGQDREQDRGQGSAYRRYHSTGVKVKTGSRTGGKEAPIGAIINPVSQPSQASCSPAPRNALSSEAPAHGPGTTRVCAQKSRRRERPPAENAPASGPPSP